MYRGEIIVSGVSKTETEAVIREAVEVLDSQDDPRPGLVREAVRAAIAELAAAAPGKSVEVRVPPYAAVQCIAGPKHTRGTPPNVVECAPETFLQLVSGRVSFRECVADGRVSASGPRADISGHLPLV